MLATEACVVKHHQYFDDTALSTGFLIQVLFYQLQLQFVCGI